MYSLQHLINCSTRITCNNSTLIDHILTNIEDNIMQSDLINTAISHHPSGFPNWGRLVGGTIWTKWPKTA